MNNNRSDDQPNAVPAATLILFRARAEAASELLVVERSSKMAFAGGAIVFPGGKIDPGDHLIAEGLGFEDGAARVAAIRETLEESGIAIGFASPPKPDWTTAAQQRLHAGEDFGALLNDSGLTLDLGALTPWARWRPGQREMRVFDTYFFIARADDAPDPVVDDTENVRSFWSGAQEIIDAADAGKVHIIFPTRRNLERLALYGDFEDARSHAQSIPVEIVTTYLEERADGKYLCFPEHHGYPVTAENIDSVRRGFDRRD
jgi:8-oxo-dGTP pyrophosphatase MutT (NUDIX family)